MFKLYVLFMMLVVLQQSLQYLLFFPYQGIVSEKGMREEVPPVLQYQILQLALDLPASKFSWFRIQVRIITIIIVSTCILRHCWIKGIALLSAMFLKCYAFLPRMLQIQIPHQERSRCFTCFSRCLSAAAAAI